MFRTCSTIMIAVASTLIPLAVPAHAERPIGSYYTAVEASPQGRDSAIISGAIWHRTANGLRGPRAGSRPEIVCAQVARKFGELRSFTADGVAFDAEQMASCNQRAR